MGDRVLSKANLHTAPAYLAEPAQPGPAVVRVAFFRRELKD